MTPLKINWEMKVAVISTAHHPEGWKPEDDILGFIPSAACNDSGPIVYLEDIHENTPGWFSALAASLTRQGFSWVRFDPAADVVSGLSTFEWK